MRMRVSSSTLPEARARSKACSIHHRRAEIAHLEDPSRIERLSTHYLGFKPVDPKRESSVEALPQVAAQVEKPAADKPQGVTP